LTYAWLPLVEGVGIIQPPPEALLFSWIAFIPPRIVFPADASTLRRRPVQRLDDVVRRALG
jgi:hypothetical protein